MGVPRESEWADMQKTVAGFARARQGGHDDVGGSFPDVETVELGLWLVGGSVYRLLFS